MFQDLSKFDYVVIDTETTGKYWWKDKMFGFSIFMPGVGPRYYDVRDQPQAVRWLKDEMRRVKRVVNHSLKFDMHMLREAGVMLPTEPERIDCTMINAALLDEHLHTYDLDSLGMKYCGVGKDKSIYEELAKLFGGPATKDVQMQNLHRAPRSLVEKYANQDVTTTDALYRYQRDQLEQQELGKAHHLEMRLLPVIADMERGGVRVDVERAQRAMGEITTIVNRNQKSLNDIAGFPINANPSGSIHQLFKPEWIKTGVTDAGKERGHWKLCDGTIAETTEGGKASINADVLRIMKHPAAALILGIRKMLKTRDTFLKNHVLGHHHNGIIHCNYNQTKSDNDAGTGTGRLSINDPALQQIPKRDVDVASIVRAIFIPDQGMDWDCHDWSQMDFRVFAHYTKSPSILQLYEKDPDADFHQMVADLTGIRRKPRYAGDANAKQINLGMIFGMGAGKLAQEMGLPHEVVWDERRKREWINPGPETLEVLDRYYAAVPGVREFLKLASARAKEHGFVRTMLGRRIRFPGGQFTHKAGGLVFQGTAADALKVKMVEAHSYFKQLNNGARLMLSVHDELDSSVNKGDERTRQGITDLYQSFDGEVTPLKFRIPIRCSAGIGPNWHEASKE